MYLKPKKSNLNPRALVYKRYTHLETSLGILTIFCCKNTQNAYDYFIFDKDEADFVKVDLDTLPDAKQIYTITSDSQVFTFNGFYYVWKLLSHWEKSETLPQTYTTLQETGFNNIGKYKTNQYLYHCSFDYVVKGSIVGTRTQTIKGAITPLTSLNIQYYDDFVDLEVGDLVVVGNQLFSVENPETDTKHLPKDYKIYSVTLNSIL